ncbi:hypothetical protein TRFO_27776 [Tritrichomonas foetus]|uniref:Anaphase-promoting complex subunit 4 WD40 domain-containing protein n=1 Tax=Tritrichomonas foetus TaxID=1144522 RepID=A0A1J4K1H9_9EUKA|nr:hypothetical protein TRFO_27776 [Tritrichomonas foetus]|eukprot:OHT04640.1 hypothetical protein TRFO_27776 [Tritrichomonas foetus]
MLRAIKDLSAEDVEVSAIYWNKKGLFGGDLNGRIHIYETDNSNEGGLCHLGKIQSYDAHSLAVTSIACISNLVVSCSLDGSIYKYNLGTGENEKIAENINDCFILCPVESMNALLLGTTSGHLYIYTVSSKSLSEPIKIFDDTAINSISLHPTLHKAAILSETELIYFDIDNKTIEKRLKMTADSCTCAAISDNALSCVVTTTEGSVRVVDMITFKEVGCVFIEKTELNKVAPIDYGKRFIITGCNGKVFLFNLNTMLKEPGLAAGKKPLLALAVQPTDMKIAVSGCENTIKLLDFD